MTAQSLIPTAAGGQAGATLEARYEYEDTRELVRLVDDAAELLRARGEAAFDDFRMAGGRWRRDETYVFVLDLDGNMLVHPDPALEGRNDLELKDIGGKPIVRGLIAAATTSPDKPFGWYHYQWPIPGAILPRWKSTYVRLVQAPGGSRWIVGSGMYDDRMERAFVVDAVSNAVAEIERLGEAAFPALRDPTGPFIAKDAYIFVVDMDGVELVNPAFPNLEGRRLLDLRDTHGKYLNREMLELVRARGSGWVEYMWPRPGECLSTLKSAYVSGARLGDGRVMVGCGVYLAEAPREAGPVPTMTAPELMMLVRDAAAVLTEQGERAFPELRRKGSRWFRDHTYLFVLTMQGINAFHAAEPENEGRDDSALVDVLGRPFVRMFLEAASGPSGEGWVHYMYPEPGSLFPAWKSSFVKRATFPSGTQYVVGCGVYHMRMDRAFIEDVVSRAAALVEEHGPAAFDRIRDRKGPFVFMDTYVFVHDANGIELVNPAQPSLEGRDLSELRDLTGKAVVRDQIAAVERAESAWLECRWYHPGDNTPARKQTYVRKVSFGGDTYIVGSGIYVE